VPIIVNQRNQWAVKHVLAVPVGGGGPDRFMFCLSGVVIVDFVGGQPQGVWRRDEMRMNLSLEDAFRATGRVPKPGMHFEYALQQWAPILVPSAFFDKNAAMDFGIAVDDFSIDWHNGQPSQTVDVHAHIAASDIDGYLIRIAYSLTLVGDLVEVKNVVVG
jgi:hypothetical protein